MAQLMHCHSLSLASVKSRSVLPFWYQLTWVVPDEGPLNGCVCVCCYDIIAFYIRICMLFNIGCIYTVLVSHFFVNMTPYLATNYFMAVSTPITFSRWIAQTSWAWTEIAQFICRFVQSKSPLKYCFMLWNITFVWIFLRYVSQWNQIYTSKGRWMWKLNWITR